MPHFALLAIQWSLDEHNPLLESVKGAMVGGGVWWLFSTAVSTMPKPGPMERWYGWFYSFVQLVAANHTNRRSE